MDISVTTLVPLIKIPLSLGLPLPAVNLGKMTAVGGLIKTDAKEQPLSAIMITDAHIVQAGTMALPKFCRKRQNKNRRQHHAGNKSISPKGDKK